MGCFIHSGGGYQLWISKMQKTSGHSVQEVILRKICTFFIFLVGVEGSGKEGHDHGLSLWNSSAQWASVTSLCPSCFRAILLLWLQSSFPTPSTPLLLQRCEHSGIVSSSQWRLSGLRLVPLRFHRNPGIPAMSA